MNITYFNKHYRKLSVLFASLTLILLSFGLYLGFVTSPPDYQQGNFVRIMYVHVPSAWMSLFIYSSSAFVSILFLVYKNPLFDIAAKNAMIIGAGFNLVTLITGSIWGKPIWGTWWVWDARLTSVLVLQFFYFSYMILRQSFDSDEQAAKSAAILAIIGAINVPIVKFSVNFWHSLHQPASFLRIDGPHIHSSMLTPLLLMAFGSLTYFLLIILINIKTDLLQKKINKLKHHAR